MRSVPTLGSPPGDPVPRMWTWCHAGPAGGHPFDRPAPRPPDRLLRQKVRSVGVGRPPGRPPGRDSRGAMDRGDCGVFPLSSNSTALSEQPLLPPASSSGGVRRHPGSLSTVSWGCFCFLRGDRGRGQVQRRSSAVGASGRSSRPTARGRRLSFLGHVVGENT